MRVEACCLLLGAALGGCAIDLESSSDTAPADAEPALTELAACSLLPELDGLRGRTTPLALSDAGNVVLAIRPDFDGSTASAAFELAGNCGEASTPRAARPILDVSEHGDYVGTPRAGFRTDASFLYFSLDSASGFASEGTGLARYEEGSQAFISLGLLWTSDRPSYGSAVVVDGDYVYVYGGLPARFLAADVYLARVPLERVSEPAAYEYFQGGGDWTVDPDLAGPLLEGGSMPSVAWQASRKRYLMAYTTPLAREITLRSGLGPAGPWSRPFAFGACALPFAQAFCGEVSLLPELAAEDELALSQSVDAFEAPAGASERDYWTQLVRGPIPGELP